jgi:LytR cell envelope-related transcriptional attenuator
MSWAIAAISVSEQIEKYGAYAGLAAIVGLGVLSLLYFAQAREVKRLREWAGRAPERAAELEARVAADAARRAAGTPPSQPQTAAGQAGAAPATAAAAAGTPARPPASTAMPTPPGGVPVGGDSKPATPAPITRPPALPTPVPAATTAGAPAAGKAPAAGGSPTEAMPPPSQPPVPAAANGSSTSTPPPVEPVVGPRVPGRPPPGSPTPPASPPPPEPEPDAFPAPPVRPLRSGPPSRSLLVDEPAHRRPSRRVLGVLGGSLLVVAAVVVVLVLTLGGDEAPPPPNQVAETIADTTAAEPGRTQASREARIDRADTPVIVLNATGVNGLARQVAGRLQSTGYRADADNTEPRDTTLIGFKSGAEAAAREIGRLLEVPSAQVQAMPQELTAQAGAHAVVVIIGADKASG